jgi:hypothetical protein
MAKNAIILAVVVLGAYGCAPGYRVHVNGYSELAEPVEQDASIYVITDPNAPNPIFDKQIKRSANALLGGYGYSVAETAEAANYRLSFQLGVDSEKVVGHTPIFHSHFGRYGRPPGSFGLGYTTYAPSFDTLYDQWLMLRLVKPGPEGETVVWVGEAVTSTDRAELRETVDYLLAGCIEYLGVDTGRKVTMFIKHDDPRLMDIAHD